MAATVNSNEDRAVESLRRMLRENISPDFHGEIGVRVTVREGTITHIFSCAERNEKLSRESRA